MRYHKCGLGFSLLVTVANAQSLVQSVSGDSSGDILGWRVAASGDVNRDGHADFVIGVPGESRLLVYSGKDGHLIHSLSGTPGGQLGRATGPAGDVDGDLFADVFGGAPYDSTGGVLAGAAHVYSGRDGSTKYVFLGSAPFDAFGNSGCGIGDADLDGFTDVAVGAREADTGGLDAGRVRLYSGVDGHLIWTVDGGAPGDFFGWEICAAGDVNGDGRDDVLVSARDSDVGGTNAGSVRTLSGAGGVTLIEFPGWLQGVNAMGWGWSIAGGGDTDSDGFGDVVIGSVHDDANGLDSGSVRVYSGKTGTLLHFFVGDQPYSFFGWSVSTGSDVDADGYSDILAGARFHPTIYGPGMARVHSGKTGLPLFTVASGVVGDEFGLAVALPGDLDGNGRGDVVVGAYGHDNFSGTARAYATTGSCGPIASFGSGCIGSAGIAPALAFTGCPTPFGLVSITVAAAPAPTLALVVFGLSQAEIPMGGGCDLLVAPLLPPTIALNVPTTGVGGGSITASGFLPEAASGATMTMQAFVVDQGTIRGFAATSGMTVSIQ